MTLTTRHTIIALLLVLTSLMGGCVTYTEYVRHGTVLHQRGFEQFSPTPDLHEVVKLKNVTIHVVGDRKHFRWGRAARYGSPVAGYANTKNEIWLFGKIVNGKIIVNQAILGHELNHLMNFKDKRFVNPDKLEDIEF